MLTRPFPCSAGSFIAAAISRQDGGVSDGIHLLWTAPSTAGYSVEGYDVQRRKSTGKPEVSCYELSPAEIQALHRH